MRIFDVSPDFNFTTCEPMREFYVSTWFIPVAARVAERLKDWELRELGNIRKVSQLHRMTA